MHNYLNYLIVTVGLSAACGPDVAMTETDGTTGDGTTGVEDTGTTGVPTTGESTTGESTTGASTGEATTGSTGDTEDPTTTGDTTGSGEVVCGASPQDHAAACPDPCPITVDLEIGCEDERLGIYGLRVAPAPDTTWLVTSSEAAALVFRADAVDAVREEGLPAGFIDSGIAAALDPAGELHLVADATTQPDYVGGLIHAAEAEGWKETLIFDAPNKYVEALGLEVTPEGTPLVWFESDPPDGHSLATPDGQGGWQLEVAESPVTDYRQYGLGASGLPFAAAVGGKNNQVFFLQNGVSRQLSDELPAFTIPGPHYRLAYPPAPGVPMGVPEVATALYDDDGLHVGWSLMDDGFAAVDFAGTQEPPEQCFFEWDGPGSCPKEACLETGTGVQRGAYSLARTADGGLWLAVVTTQLDRTVMFVEECPEDVGCYCERKTVMDETRGELRLIGVATDGTPPVTVFTVPVENVELFGSTSDGDFDRRVDLRGFADQLALGVLTQRPGDLTPRIRLLRIDTSKIAP